MVHLKNLTDMVNILKNTILSPKIVYQIKYKLPEVILILYYFNKKRQIYIIPDTPPKYCIFSYCSG